MKTPLIGCLGRGWLGLRWGGGAVAGGLRERALQAALGVRLHRGSLDIKRALQVVPLTGVAMLKKWSTVFFS